jgi:ubiquinone/menaquinone biosynthesis C-methylase UbiE
LDKRRKVQAVNTNEAEFLVDKDAIRGHFSKFTRKAFEMLPKLDKPRILDIGCGSGVSTMEVADLSNGHITALDIDSLSIDRFAKKIEAAGLFGRVETVRASMFAMDFPEQSFDIIWAEGSIHVTGFAKGLREWGKLLRPGGFLAVHDELGNIGEKLEQISECGYDLLGYFKLDEQTWMNEYYAPLKKLIEQRRTEKADDPVMMALLDKEQLELDWFKQNPTRCCSVFFITRKR